MAVFPWQSTVQDQDGNAIASAQLTIREGGPAGAVATIFSDSAETSLANPFNATSDGFAQFWAAAGTYYIEAESGGQTTDGWYVVLTDTSGGVPVVLTATVAAGEAVTADGALVTEATAAEYLGIAQAGGVATDTINVQSTGNFTLGTWTWTADEYVYLTNAGAITQTPPTGTHRRIGIATAPTIIALSAGPVVVETGGAGSENAIPALSDAGLLDYTMIEKAATGGAGAENLLVQANASGEIDISFLGAVVDTSRQLTASGALTAGDAVALSAADTVEAVVEIPNAGVLGATYNPTAGTTTQQNDMTVAYDPINDVYCAVWNAANTGGLTLDIIATAFTYDAGLDTYTFGANLSLFTADFGRAVDIAFDANSGDFIVIFGEDNTTTARLAAISVSGVTCTLVTTTTLITFTSSTSAQGRVQVEMHSSDGTGFCVYGVGTSTDSYSARPFSYNGATFSLGTQLTISSTEGNDVGSALKYSTSQNKYLLATGFSIGTTETVAWLVTSDGSTATLSTRLQIKASTTGIPRVAIDEVNAQAVFADRAQNTAYLLDISGASPTNVANLALTNGASDITSFYGVGFDPTTSAYILCGLAATGANDQGVRLLSVIGGTALQDDGSILTSYLSTGFNNTGGNTVVYVSTLLKHLIVFDSSSTSDTTRFSFFDPAIPTTNAFEFIGFAQATVADTETVDVAMLGDVNTSQTGLTFGTDYFIASDGTLSAVDTGYGKVGRALSATEILVTKNTWST